MKAVPFTTLENAVISTGQGFGPVADGVLLIVESFLIYLGMCLDITIFADTDARSAAGNFLRVPLLVGNTAQEGDVFIVAAERLSLGFDIPILTPAAADAVTQVIILFYFIFFHSITKKIYAGGFRLSFWNNCWRLCGCRCSGLEISV